MFYYCSRFSPMLCREMFIRPRRAPYIHIKPHFGQCYYFVGHIHARRYVCTSRTRVSCTRCLFWYFYGAQICCYSFYYIIASAYKQHREDIYELTQACASLPCCMNAHAGGERSTAHVKVSVLRPEVKGRGTWHVESPQ